MVKNPLEIKIESKLHQGCCKQHQYLLEWDIREMVERSIEKCMAGAKQGCWHKRIVDDDEIINLANETGLYTIDAEGIEFLRISKTISPWRNFHFWWGAKRTFNEFFKSLATITEIMQPFIQII